MKWIYAIPLLIGTFGILQGVLNKHLAIEIGVAHATLIGMTATFFLGILVYLVIKANPEILPPFYSVKQPLSFFKWWYIIPGLLGFFIVFFFPQAMYELGAVKVTILIVAGQIITSALWDYFVEGIPLTTFKALGVVFAILSLIFSVVEKKA